MDKLSARVAPPVNPATTATFTYMLDTAATPTTIPAALDSTLAPPMLTAEIDAGDADSINNLFATFSLNKQSKSGPASSFTVAALLPGPEVPGAVSLVFVGQTTDQASPASPPPA